MRRKGNRMGENTPGDQGTWGDPYASYDQNFQSSAQQPYDVFSASPTAGAEDLKKQQAISQRMPTAVTLPTNLFIPEDAQSVDISALANIPAGSTQNLMTFQGRQGSMIRFIGYAIFNDALMLENLNLVPRVNGKRIFPFHGNPNLNFKLGLGLAPDLSNLVPCQLDIQPHDILTWDITNNEVVDIAVGVRMSGYMSQGILRSTGRFGG